MEIAAPDINIAALLPEIIITLFACLALMVQVFKCCEMNRRYIPCMFSALTISGVVIAAGILIANLGTAPISTFNGTWAYDDFSRLFKIAFLISLFLTILLSARYTDEEGIEQGEYYAILLFATVGMMIMAGATDMITIFMGLELMSICLYILAGCVRSRRSIEASLKYFILGSFASGFLIYGMALIYGASGSTNVYEIGRFITEESIKTNPILLIGMALLVVGFGFKIALVPFHMWTPDVYDGAPAPVAAFMSVGPKAAAFAAFARVLYEALPGFHRDWTMLLSILAVVTMTIGNVTALRQKSVKRMLAYSSISHSGFILIGIIAGGSEGLPSVLYYIMTYTFMNIGAFAVLTLIAMKGEKRTNYEDYKGLWRSSPGLAIVMSLFLFSLAGIPPLAGFMGKFYVLMAAVKANYICLAVAGVINSVIAVYYYLRVTIMMYFDDPEERPSAPLFYPAMTAVLAISVTGVLVMGLIPSLYISLARTAVFVGQ